MNFYGSCANLPGQLLQQEFCVNFISTSPHASTAEQFSVIRDQIKYVSLLHITNSKLNRWIEQLIKIPFAVITLQRDGCAVFGLCVPLYLQTTPSNPKSPRILAVMEIPNAGNATLVEITLMQNLTRVIVLITM